MDAFFQLTPQWIRFDQFWIALKKRNRWLIQLRYGAVAMLIAFIVAFEFIPTLSITVLPLALICAWILLYNFVFHSVVDRIPETQARFHGLHFALIQIATDFVALLLFVYYTGGIETPFQILFVFHIIIGSLILPGRIVSLIIILTVLISACGASLELSGVIPHFRIEGLLGFDLYRNPYYLVLHFGVFTVALFICNYLANSVSKELYKREQALSQAYKELQEAEKQKSRYVMSVVHDLKTPIAAAITYLNMMLDGSLGPHPPEFDRPLKRSHLRLSNAIAMIGDVLQLSQIKLSTTLELAPVSLVSMLEEIYQDMRILFEAKKLVYCINPENKEDRYEIDAEPRLLKLAVSNLISNARKYTEEHGRVVVTLSRNQKHIKLVVADTGIGIPEKELDKVFQDFYRTSLTKKKGIEGTGLGMSIVSHIIGEHKGSVSVTSPSGIGDDVHPGTAFTITLPVQNQTELKQEKH